MTEGPKRGNGGDLAAKVTEWLSKQGFPFEMDVARVFLGKEWSVTQSVYYVDSNTQKSREIDLIARTSEYLDDPKVRISLTFVVECKYSRDKPWVLLTANAARCSLVGTDRLPVNDSGRILVRNLRSQDVKDQPFLLGPSATAYSAVTAFRGDGTDDAFAAPLAAAKAAYALAETKSRGFLFEKAFGTTVCKAWCPLVVIDGRLFAAGLTEKGLNSKEINWGRLLIKNPEIGGAETVVDVVTRAGLPDYLRAARLALRAMAEVVKEEPAVATEELLRIKGILSSRRKPTEKEPT